MRSRNGKKVRKTFSSSRIKFSIEIEVLYKNYNKSQIWKEKKTCLESIGIAM